MGIQIVNFVNFHFPVICFRVLIVAKFSELTGFAIGDFGPLKCLAFDMF